MAPEQNSDYGSPDPSQVSNQSADRRDSGQADSAAATGRPSHAPPQPSTADRFRSGVAPKNAGGVEHDQEEEIWSGGYSPKAMLGTWLALIVLSVLAVVGTVMFEVIPWMVTGIGLLAIWLIAAGVYAFRRFGVHYELTSQRFIHQSGVLTRHTDRIEVIEIDDVSYRQGPIQRLLGIGSIVIISSDRSHPELSMVGIDDVKSVAGLIDDIRRTERRRRSLHIASM